MTRRWLGVFGVPAITPRSLTVFRALLGFGFLLIVLDRPIGAVPREAQRAYSPLASFEWVRTLAATETGARTVHLLACASAVTFAAGLLSRVSYIVLVGALLVRTLLILHQSGTHDWDTPIVTLLALLPVRWGDAPGLLVLLRGRSNARPLLEANRAYGFAIWLPGLTIGLAYAAAAYAKLQRNGFDWVTSGAVRYYFVEDALNTPFTLGTWIATQPRLAVLMSLGAILVESLFILVVFFRNWRLRAAVGLAGAGLMAGFFVFQGVRWWPWLILFIAFLPWNLGERADVPPSRPTLTAVHAFVVAALVIAQGWASYHAIEVEPLLSNYPMYTQTYESPEDYERAHARLRFEAAGADITDRVERARGIDVLETAIQSGETAGDLPPDVTAQLAQFGTRYRSLHGTAPSAIDVLLVRRPFDWQRGEFESQTRERIGTVRLPD